MSLAAETRRAAADHPFLVDALRAGIVNHTAAARFLDVEGEIDAISTALRRYGEDLPAYETAERDARVTMRSGVGPIDDADDAILAVGETAIGPMGGDGDRTAILATGAVDATALSGSLQALAHEGIDVASAGVGEETMILIVGRRDGANAVRAIERSLETVVERGAGTLERDTGRKNR